MSKMSPSITESLERLRNDVDQACARAHRNASSVALMAVSKTQPVEAVLEAYAAGQRLFGENRVQEAQSKFDSILPLEGLDLHLIGPLQNNKTSKAAEIFHAIETIDSLKTAERLDASARSLGKTLPILVEVKLSHEETKHGLSPDALPLFLESLATLTNLTVRGLMTVPPWSEDAEVARPYFQHLRQLRDESVERHPTLTELSMGMSNDFRVAVEEGSTIVRVGTAIFGKRAYV
jgi:pyridoxal phosphate enzyme (YggS family)